MTPSPPFERLMPDPFARANPFRLLAASPADDTAALSDRATTQQQQAASQADEVAVREALRELTADPIQRAEWELLTSHLPTPATPPTAPAELLGRLLFGEPAHPDLADDLARFAVFLGWDKRPADAAKAPEWWRIATHRHGDRWEYWHQLALLYHRQARAAETVVAPAEAACSRGESEDSTELGRLGAFWARAYRCWARAADDAGLWDTIRGHVAGLTGFAPARFDRLRSEFVAQLANLKAAQLEQTLRARNRLAAARHRRFLALLETHADYAAFHAPARAAVDRLVHKLWPLVRRHRDKKDWPKAFDELVNGLLVIAPGDLAAVTEAGGALQEVALAEEARLNGEYDTALGMGEALEGYIDPLCRHVFPAFPAENPVNPDATNQEQLSLQWYFGMRLAAGDGPLDRHRRCMQAISENLNRTNA